jgi:nicotinate-nucleotide adenylyltransferase
MPGDALPIAEPGMRIGLFGGSFNPPHEGHRLVALECLKRLALDRVWILVSPGNPLKDQSELLPLSERLAQTVKLMDDPRLEVTAFEADQGFAYTFETVRYLTRIRPKARFVWMMGADSLQTFDRWEHWQEIARLLPLAIYDRPAARFVATTSPAAVALAKNRISEEAAKTLADRTPPAWVYLHGVVSNQSSTAIRNSRRTPA